MAVINKIQHNEKKAIENLTSYLDINQSDESAWHELADLYLLINKLLLSHQ